MSDCWFFITDTSLGSSVYSIDLGIQLFATDSRARALNLCVKILPELKTVLADKDVVKKYQQYAINRKQNRARFNKLKKGTYVWHT